VRILTVLIFVATVISPVFGSACLNPCTGSLATTQDTTDRTNFNSDNSSLIFSNITFDNATGTYDASTPGLNSSTASSAQLYGLSFIGCLSGQSPCVSNSDGGLIVGTLASWNGGVDSALTNAQKGYNPSHSATITITLPANVLAVGFDLLLGNSVPSGNTTPFGVVLDNGSLVGFDIVTAVNLPGSVFFGYSSASAITSLTVFAQNTVAAQSTIGLDNLEIGLAGGSSGGGGSSAAPEATTMLLVASGLFLVRFGHRFVRRAPTGD
jgi:hypothetical protein